jgi:hypothetical protein
MPGKRNLKVLQEEPVLHFSWYLPLIQKVAAVSEQDAMCSVLYISVDTDDSVTEAVCCE